MVERKKIAEFGEGGSAGGLGNLSPQSRPVGFSSRLYFSSFRSSESLGQAMLCKPGMTLLARSSRTG